MLTAAHCPLREGRKMTDIEVQLGGHNLFEPQQVRKVKRIITPPNYRRRPGVPGFQDIALMELSEPVVFTDKIRPICLPTKSMESFDNLKFTGWGRHQIGNDEMSKVLKEYDATGLDTNTCRGRANRHLPPHMRQDAILPEHLCIAFEQHSSTCVGDSGSPLASVIQGRSVQAGVMNWGWTCQNARRPEGSPIVFARVSSYLDWIKDNTKNAKWCQSPFQ